MRITKIETTSIRLRFWLSFGHSLATRSASENLLVRVTLDDGTIGYGESIPRDYVTGEHVASAAARVNQDYAPLLINRDFADMNEARALLRGVFAQLDLERKPFGSSFCALELAALDAVARSQGMTLARALGPVLSGRVRYGGVVPFGGQKALTAMLLFYRAYGYETVKIKVGKDLETDLNKVRLARKIMGPKAILRVDANCAWTADETLKAAEAFRKYKVSSYEQPVPAEDLDGLKRLSCEMPEDIVVDESLCTVEQARILARERMCNAFNIRISKVGGLLCAAEMVSIAKEHGLRIHMGAQVGESGILSAAGRTFGCINEPFENYEGSANSFLLRVDLTQENLTAGPGGWGDLSYIDQGGNCFGLGVTPKEELMANLPWTETTAASVGKLAVLNGI